MEDDISWLTLAQAPGLHAGSIAEFVATGQSPLALLAADVPPLGRAGLSSATLRALRQPDPNCLQAGLAWLQSGPSRQLVPWGSAQYPHLLSMIPDAPLVLFVEGSADALSLPQLALVGSRNPTALGRDTAHQFAAELAGLGLAITSGLALGIDAASHRGALQAAGRTIAVLGCGLDAIYPRENQALAEAIVAAGGALVADLPVGALPLKHNFPRRNRIISGLSVGTLVIEAALQSGSLITARLAAEQGREVFAIPGSIHNTMARGCHRLLRQGAKLVESVDDIFCELGPMLGESARFMPVSRSSPPRAAEASLDKENEILLDALGFQPASLDELVGRTGQKTDAVASMLLMLELDGRIQQQPGGLYSRMLPGKVR